MTPTRKSWTDKESAVEYGELPARPERCECPSSRAMTRALIFNPTGQQHEQHRAAHIGQVSAIGGAGGNLYRLAGDGIWPRAEAHVLSSRRRHHVVRSRGEIMPGFWPSAAVGGSFLNTDAWRRLASGSTVPRLSRTRAATRSRSPAEGNCGGSPLNAARIAVASVSQAIGVYPQVLRRVGIRIVGGGGNYSSMPPSEAKSSMSPSWS